MVGFPNLDAVERHMHGQTANAVNNGGVATQTPPQAPPQPMAQPAYQAQVPQAPQVPQVVDNPFVNQASITTIMLTDTQFDKLLGAIAAQPMLPAMTQSEVAAVLGQAGDLTPNGVNFGGNIVDTLGNATLGTVNRVGKTLTTLVDNMLDIVTLGYGKQ